MFLLTDMTDSRWINVKCDPDRAVELRETYEEVSPGWHMNKRHWNTVRTDGDLPAGLIREWIRDSYLLVVKSLPVFSVMLIVFTPLPPRLVMRYSSRSVRLP